LGAIAASNIFNVSPQSGELIYTGVQVGVGLGTGAAAGRFLTVPTPYGRAFQDMSPDALALRQSVYNGAPVYRGGTLGRSETGEAMFWAPEGPWVPGFGAKYGIPQGNIANYDFQIMGTVNRGTRFVTRPAPGIGSNPGGALEVVTQRNGVSLQYFGGR
jgi:hypothetical protein